MLLLLLLLLLVLLVLLLVLVLLLLQVRLAVMVMTGTGDWCQLIHASQRHVRQVDSRQGQLMSVVRARRPRRARRGVAVVVADEMTPQCGGVQRIRLGTQVLACRHHVVDNVDSVRFNSAAGQ